ncbi:MAG: carbohydrate kinase [Bacteroidales bacterium]|nr:carbohydrate kinase [Bacteroidales bacterium]
MYILGFDIGSSSVKASLIEAVTGRCVASSFQPKQEMEIMAASPGWAEQDPEMWWKYLKMALMDVLEQSEADKSDIKSIGISYQMHGLVLIDKQMHVLRPSIIWCDSRAVEIGDEAFTKIGPAICLESMLNSPGNFTASKLKWVRDNEPEIYRKIHKIMLPGDYIAMKFTGKINTTVSGLSEGIFWDFKKNSLSGAIMSTYGFDRELIPDIVPTFSIQGELTKKAAEETGLIAGTPVAYRAGDQPNNALSLNVLNPGEIAATAGTSGVVYGVSDVVKYDPQSRVNTFAHVNHTADTTRLGVLLCVNGTGILNSWLKKNVAGEITYHDMNKLAEEIPVGSNGLIVLPFGNGAERMLGNKNTGGNITNLNFNIHNKAHLFRAAQEGIVFSFKYGMDIMESTGIKPSVIRAGNSNMFLSEIFRDTLAGITGAVIELYNTDGAQGAAIGGGIGSGIFKSFNEGLSNLKKLQVIEPDRSKMEQYKAAYLSWKSHLDKMIKNI